MFALLHLNFLSPRDKLFIKGDIRNAMWATLTHDFEWVASTCNNIACKVHSSFDDTDSSLDRSFNKSFGRLIDYFPHAFCQIPDKDVRIAEDVDGCWYLIDLFEYLFFVKFWQLIYEATHADVPLIKPW